MNFCILANPEKYSVQEPMERVLHWCVENNVRIFLPTELKHHFPNVASQPGTTVTGSESEAAELSDIVIAIGGDGTMLHTAHLVKSIPVPVLGINTGKLGFMANIQPDSIENALSQIVSKNFTLDKRALLKAGLPDGTSYYALNEFLFSKKDTSSMITLRAEYDGVFINNYWADGLLVSSPTGSTAYNLSAGGPIVIPNTRVMVLTPINPHTLTTRPLVLPSDRSLRIKNNNKSNNTLFSYDGITVEVESEMDVTISQSDYSINLIQFPGQNHFETLRNKLMWGLDKRKE